MPTNRRPLRRDRKARITPEAITAWLACDWRALHRALGIDVFGPSPLPMEIGPFGVSEDFPPDPKSGRCWDQEYLAMIALQRELLAVAGWPNCREVYKKHLAEAIEDRDYRALLLRDPDSRHKGTGMDDASLRERLAEAKVEVVYRRKLLAGLDAQIADYDPHKRSHAR
jgi:hypothetical protein